MWVLKLWKINILQSIYSKHSPHHLWGACAEESACAWIEGRGKEIISFQLQSEAGSVIIRERKYMFSWEVEDNITVVLWFGPGDLCYSLPTTSALRFGHGQPDFSFPLSLPISRSIAKKFEQTIFSQAWKLLIFFHSVLHLRSQFRMHSWGQLWFCFLFFVFLIASPWQCGLAWTIDVLLVPSPVKGTFASACTLAAICSFRHWWGSDVGFTLQEQA